MMDQQLIISSLAMDLKRIAIGLHRGSIKMAEKFTEEALLRIQELKRHRQDSYLEKLIRNTSQALTSKSEIQAEELLMYSILFQNIALKKTSDYK